MRFFVLIFISCFFSTQPAICRMCGLRAGNSRADRVTIRRDSACGSGPMFQTGHSLQERLNCQTVPPPCTARSSRAGAISNGSLRTTPEFYLFIVFVIFLFLKTHSWEFFCPMESFWEEERSTGLQAQRQLKLPRVHRAKSGVVAHTEHEIPLCICDGTLVGSDSFHTHATHKFLAYRSGGNDKDPAIMGRSLTCQPSALLFLHFWRSNRQARVHHEYNDKSA